jgi:tRNA A58 N-methylase Trm61
MPTVKSLGTISWAFAVVFCVACASAGHALQVSNLTPSNAKPAFLGIEFVESEGWGIAVGGVVAGSGADNAGIRAEDRVLGIAGETTETTDEVRAVLAKHSAGESVQVVFRRAQTIEVVELMLGERSNDPSEIKKVLDVLELQPGQVVADIGFGSGWITVGLAEATGPEGGVFAVEISADRIEAMKQRAIDNVTCVLSKPDDITLEKGALDLALLHDVASHVNASARRGFYASIARALKAGGALVIFEPHGKAREMLDELSRYGFHTEGEKELEGLSNSTLDARLKEGLRFVYRDQK